MDSDTSILLKFGQTIRKLRNDENMSQKSFAKKCGLDRTYISDVECGKRNIGLKNIELMALNLGVKISDLFKD